MKIMSIKVLILFLLYTFSFVKKDTIYVKSTPSFNLWDYYPTKKNPDIIKIKSFNLCPQFEFILKNEILKKTKRPLDKYYQVMFTKYHGTINIIITNGFSSLDVFKSMIKINGKYLTNNYYSDCNVLGVYNMNDVICIFIISKESENISNLELNKIYTQKNQLCSFVINYSREKTYDRKEDNISNWQYIFYNNKFKLIKTENTN